MYNLPLQLHSCKVPRRTSRRTCAYDVTDAAVGLIWLWLRGLGRTATGQCGGSSRSDAAALEGALLTCNEVSVSKFKLES